jgi:ketosteroid isomerase-like protein
MWKIVFQGFNFFHLVHKGIFQEKNGKPEPFGFPQNEMQKQIDIETIALQFNDCINKQDLTGLVNLMTDDHIFIDSANNQVIGKSSNKENRQKFFHLFPDYRNTFEVVSSTDSTVIMQGYSVCSDNRLNSNRAIWVARIANDKLAEWHVYLDNEENRHFLGL